MQPAELIKHEYQGGSLSIALEPRQGRITLTYRTEVAEYGTRVTCSEAAKENPWFARPFEEIAKQMRSLPTVYISGYITHVDFTLPSGEIVSAFELTKMPSAVAVESNLATLKARLAELENKLKDERPRRSRSRSRSSRKRSRSRSAHRSRRSRSRSVSRSRSRSAPRSRKVEKSPRSRDTHKYVPSDAWKAAMACDFRTVTKMISSGNPFSHFDGEYRPVVFDLADEYIHGKDDAFGMILLLISLTTNIDMVRYGGLPFRAYLSGFRLRGDKAGKMWRLLTIIKLRRAMVA